MCMQDGGIEPELESAAYVARIVPDIVEIAMRRGTWNRRTPVFWSNIRIDGRNKV